MRRFSALLTLLTLSCVLIAGCKQPSGDLTKESFDDPAVAEMIQNHSEILAEMRALSDKGLSPAERTAKMQKLMKNPGMNRRISSRNMSRNDQAKFMAYIMKANKEIMSLNQ